MDSTQLWTLTDGNAGNRRQVDALAAALTHGPVLDWVLEPQAPWRWCAPRVVPGASAAFGASFAHVLGQPPHLAIGCGRQGALATRLLRQRGSTAVQILDPLQQEGRAQTAYEVARAIVAASQPDQL